MTNSRRHTLALLGMAFSVGFIGPALAQSHHHGGGATTTTTTSGSQLLGVDHGASEDTTTTTSVNALGQKSTTTRTYDTSLSGYTIDTSTVNADGSKSNAVQSVTLDEPRTAPLSDSHGGLQNVTTFGAAPRSGGGYAPQAQTVSHSNTTTNASSNVLTANPFFNSGGSVSVNAAPSPADINANAGLQSSAHYNGD